jgi:hypothetical protein
VYGDCQEYEYPVTPSPPMRVPPSCSEYKHGL